MIDPKLMDVAMERITGFGFGHKVRSLRYAENMAELHSCLREYVFGSDNKTDIFLRQCKESVSASQSVANTPLAQK